MKRVILLALFAFTVTANVLPAAEKAGPGANLPEKKRTVLGLYATAKEAYDKWKADPKNVKILDVRTPGEYVFVGHPAMAVNIPLMFMEDKWSPERKAFAMRPNPDFLAQAKKRFQPADTILITCRSGVRSARAADLLAKAGFKRVYNITDGFEGDAVKDPASPDHGKRTRNGWKNSGAPWTYDLQPELIDSP